MYIQTVNNRFFHLEEIRIIRGETVAHLIDVYAVKNKQPVQFLDVRIPNEVLDNSIDIEESVAEWLVSEEGNFPEGYILEDDEYDLLDAKSTKLDRVKELRDIWEITPVQTPFGIVDADTKSQQKITGAVVMALILTEQFTVKWRMFDNSIVDLNSQTMIQMGMIVGQTVAKYQMVKNYFDDLINSATTLEDLELIDIEQNWLTLELP